jgi:D-alanyl-D-alanine carboxypeptidase
MRYWGLGLLVGLLAMAGAARADITDRANYAAIILDARGQVLHAANADEQRFPASLTKMMTLYMLFEAMRDGRVPPESRIQMSREAASRPRSKLFLPAGYSLGLEDAILALVTRSANDVATAIAEHLGGDEERFAQAMTQRARSLGMTRTTFRNASGLPNAEQTTTARDMALLGSRLLADFPRQYAYFSTREFRWNRQTIHNHNHMLSAYDGADGIKTGYTVWSGYNIVTSARRDGVRLIGAVLGGGSWHGRDRHMAELLDEAFQRSGVARRGSSYDVAQTNRGAIREAAAVEPQSPRLAGRLVPGPRIGTRAQPPGRPAAQVLAVRPARTQVRLAAAPGRAIRAVPQRNQLVAATRGPIGRTTRGSPRLDTPAATAVARPRAIELRGPASRANPARPVTRT